MKKIISFNISEKVNDSLSAATEGKFDLERIEAFEGLLDIEPSEYSAIFLFLESDFESENLETILKYFGQIPVNIILESENFSHLMLAYHYQANAVFCKTVNKDELDQALTKIELLSENNRNEIPVSQIIKLYSGPVKIISNLDFYNRMAVYFKSFNFESQFTLLITPRTGDPEIFGKSIEDKTIEQIKKIKLSRKYIGDIFHLGQSTLAAPCFSISSQTVWCVLEVDESYKKFLFNQLLFKFWESVMLYRVAVEKEKSLELLAKTDEVTGLYNQRKLSEDLESAVADHEKEHEKFSLMFIDVDHFKNVNDSHGHLVGSQLLQDLGRVLINILRQSDHVYRYGGDEFVVIIPHVDIKTVYSVATRVLESIKATDFKVEDGDIYKMSVSIGIAEYPTDAKSALEIIKFADEMMYMSKKSGRGKVFHINEVDDASLSS